MSFSKSQASFSSNFTWLFSVTKDKLIYFAKKGPMNVQILEAFECSDQNSPNSPNSCHFWNSKSVFLQILHQSSVSWDITLLYCISFNVIYIQKREPIKVQIWSNFTWAVKMFLKFCTLMGSFCKNHIKFQLKKYRGVIFHDTEQLYKIWRNADLVVSKMA